MKSFELAVNIERVIRSLKNTWTIIKPAWGVCRWRVAGAEAAGAVEKIFFRLFFVTMARKDTWF